MWRRAGQAVAARFRRPGQVAQVGYQVCLHILAGQQAVAHVLNSIKSGYAGWMICCLVFPQLIELSNQSGGRFRLV